MEFIKKKSHIEYDMNSIEKYIQGGDFDGSLKKTWDGFEAELKDVEREIALLSNSETKEIEEKKLQLMDEIRGHEAEIAKLQNQVKELEKMVLTKG